MFRGDRDLDTICALATPQGHGALAIVRLSGSRSLEIGRQVAPFLVSPKSHHAYFGTLCYASGIQMDEALVTYFSNGKSFTGEEALEFSIHGSPFLVGELLKTLCCYGARIADRGEFTYRAFLNGKVDLIQAESVLSMIQSQNSVSAGQALRQLKGELSKQLEFIESELTWGLAHIEAGIDFSMEGLETVAADELVGRLTTVANELSALVESYRSGRYVHDGIRVVIMGRPNVGKSSLFNALLGDERAIVTDIAGTTRDLIDGRVLVAGTSVTFVDTAGLRETSDFVEQIGIVRTKEAGQSADVVLFVFDSKEGLTQGDLHEIRQIGSRVVIVIGNKADLVDSTQGIEDQVRQIFQHERGSTPREICFASALEKTNSSRTIFLALKRWIDELELEDRSVVFNSRHFEALSSAGRSLERGLLLVKQSEGSELAAIDLKEALLFVQEVLGKHYDDQILDRVFREFCIGK